MGNHDFMTVKDLSGILSELPDDMKIVIPVVDELDVNHIYGFRKVRTAGILRCESEQDVNVFCINGTVNDQDLADQVRSSGKDVDAVRILYGNKEKENA